ncbi:hypothetical protein [Planomicrobium sp. CPCC 101110]|uniref:hypothetical protein n=1 Tax=Planomicrobium sp. CPCC 101110 TaxID=2599619 RepID=UPI0011B65133|nr:hypothetical protein [Planomicrobium sp. CPCC 101110]TWT27797.1 hypothetical protein FQV30_04615 [Planomicrobium sp. CPCC 101110]
MKPIIRPLSTLLMGGTYLLSIFYPFPIATGLVSLFALVALLSFFPYLNRVPKLLILALTIGALSMEMSREGLQHFFTGLQTNANVLAIFIFVPLLAIPIKQGNYLTYVEVIFSSYIKKTHQLYLFSTISAASIGAVMNVGSLPILYQLTDTKAFQPYTMMRLKSMSRGFVLAFLWSPYFISVGLVLAYFDISWLQLFVPGISLALLILLMGWLLEGRNREEIPIEMPLPNQAELKKAKRKVMELALIVALITAIIMVVENITGLSVLTVIPLVAILMSFLWSLFFSTKQQLADNYRSFFNSRIPGMGNELSLFIIAGAFGTALLDNGAEEWILSLLDALNISNVLLLIPVIALLMAVPAIVGLHPVITATILAITLSGSPLFMEDHLYLSLGLLSSWMAAILISPFSGVNLLLAAISRKSPFEISLKNNAGFSGLLWIVCYVGIVILYFIR